MRVSPNPPMALKKGAPRFGMEPLNPTMRELIKKKFLKQLEESGIQLDPQTRVEVDGDGIIYIHPTPAQMDTIKALFPPPPRTREAFLDHVKNSRSRIVSVEPDPDRRTNPVYGPSRYFAETQKP